MLTKFMAGAFSRKKSYDATATGEERRKALVLCRVCASATNSQHTRCKVYFLAEALIESLQRTKEEKVRQHLRGFAYTAANLCFVHTKKALK